MDRNNLYDAGEKIFDAVQSAVETGNYSRLNQTVRDTVYETLDSAGDYKNIQGNRTGPAGNQLYASTSNSFIASLAVLCGVLGAGFFGIITLLLFFQGLVWFDIFSLFGGLITGLVCVVCGVIALKGHKTKKRVERFRAYVRIIGNREFCSIDELTKVSRKSRDKTADDLQTMINKGMFLEGHIDDQKTTLMVTTRTYDYYLEAQKAYRRRTQEMRQQEENRRMRDQNQGAGQWQREEPRDTRDGGEKDTTSQRRPSSEYSAEVQAILREGNDYIRHIHETNEKIPDAVMSAKLERLESITERIFQQVAQNPERADDLHKFMNYYLPTTARLLDAYVELDAQPVAGENIAGTKKEIEDTLDTINDAFENLLDRFFRDTAWDISSDISVMKTMLEQEGLVEGKYQMPVK